MRYAFLISASEAVRGTWSTSYRSLQRTTLRATSTSFSEYDTEVGVDGGDELGVGGDDRGDAEGSEGDWPRPRDWSALSSSFASAVSCMRMLFCKNRSAFSESPALMARRATARHWRAASRFIL